MVCIFSKNIKLKTLKNNLRKYFFIIANFIIANYYQIYHNAIKMHKRNKNIKITDLCL